MYITYMQFALLAEFLCSHCYIRQYLNLNYSQVINKNYSNFDVPLLF